MKLYLSSYRIPTPNSLFELVGKDPLETKVAVIPNAKDYYAERARTIKIRDATDYLAKLGLIPTVVDLRDYSRSYSLEHRLRPFDMLWVMGGNTFCLMHEIRRSGFEQAAKSVLNTGIVYAGESAGAVVAGMSLKGIESADEPEFAESITYQGMNLVPYVVLPHIDNKYFKEANGETRRLHGNDPRLELKDTQAAVITSVGVTITEGDI